MKVDKISKEKWAELSEKAHLIVFSEVKKAETERIDFALCVLSEQGVPLTYTTCREMDAETLYWQYGGSFPGTRGTIASFSNTLHLLEWAKQNGYKRVCFYVENDNQPMLKLAMKCGFKITGVRNYKSHILLEHLKEFEWA